MRCTCACLATQDAAIPAEGTWAGQFQGPGKKAAAQVPYLLQFLHGFVGQLQVFCEADAFCTSWETRQTLNQPAQHSNSWVEVCCQGAGVTLGGTGCSGGGPQGTATMAGLSIRCSACASPALSRTFKATCCGPREPKYTCSQAAGAFLQLLCTALALAWLTGG